MSKNEKALLNHFVRVWRASFLSNAWRDKYFSDAENFLEEHYPEWLDYVHDFDAFQELTINDKLKS